MSTQSAAKRSRSQQTNDTTGQLPQQPQALSTQQGLVALHRSRLFDWKPSAVVAISPCPGAPLFAVGYENGSLELWDVHQLVCTQAVVGPSLELTSVTWARDTVDRSWRTFAAFLDGSVAEVLWRQACVGHALDVAGGVVWALAAQPAGDVRPGFAHQVAAACDDGSVRLLGCEGGEPGLVLERVLARLEGRLLCCAWHNGSAALAVAGTSGNIHLLDAATGRETVRITARAASTRPLTVWRLLCLADGTLVSGDSDGATQMWDGRFGTLLQRFAQHKADVLALAAADGGNAVFAAGVDSQVAMFQRVAPPAGPSAAAGGRPNAATAAAAAPSAWVYTHYKRPHTHDVRALAAVTLGGDKGSVLLSGGVDAQLLAYRARAFLEEHPMRLTKCPQRPACYAAPGAQPAPLLLCAQPDCLDVWQAAEVAQQGRQQLALAPPRSQHQQTEGHPLELSAGPRHVARIALKGARCASASISPSGGYVAATTPAGTRLYALSSASAMAGQSGAPAAAPEPPIKRLRLDPRLEEPAVSVAVTDDSLVVALRDGSLACCSLPAGELVGRTPPAAPRHAAAAAGGGGAGGPDNNAWRELCAPAARLCASADGRLVAALGGGGLSLYSLPALEPAGRPLRSEHAITAMALSADGQLLAATTSACQLLVWDTADGRPLQWALDNADAARAALERLPGAPAGLGFGAPAAAAAAPLLLVYGAGGFVHFDLTKPVDRKYLEAASVKRVRGRARPDQRPGLEERPEGRGINGRVVRCAQPCVWLGYIAPGEVMMLEKPWEEVLAGLPPPLVRQRYGR